MANYKVTHARFYPVKKNRINKKLTEWIIADITDDLKTGWERFYNYDKDNEFFDLIFNSKSSIDFDIFKSKEVLDNFHIWLRISDEGGARDLIAFKSKFFKERRKYDFNYEIEYYNGSEYRNLNYVKRCLYAADSISFNLKEDKTETIKELFLYHNENVINYNPKKGIWNYNFECHYYKSCYRSYDHDKYGGKTTNLNYYEEFLGEGAVDNLLHCDRKFLINDKILNRIYKWSKEHGYPRIDDNILSINLNFNSQNVHKWWWETSENRWAEESSTNWENVSDEEYIRFLEYYKNE